MSTESARTGRRRGRSRSGKAIHAGIFARRHTYVDFIEKLTGQIKLERADDGYRGAVTSARAATIISVWQKGRGRWKPEGDGKKQRSHRPQGDGKYPAPPRPDSGRLRHSRDAAVVERKNQARPRTAHCRRCARTVTKSAKIHPRQEQTSSWTMRGHEKPSGIRNNRAPRNTNIPSSRQRSRPAKGNAPAPVRSGGQEPASCFRSARCRLFEETGPKE